MSHTIGHTQSEEDMSENAEKIADSDITAKPEETVMGGEEKKEAIKSLHETVARHEHLLGSLQVHAEEQKQVCEMIHRALQDVQCQLAVISSQLGLTSKAQPEIYESGKVEIKLDDSGTKLHRVFDKMSTSVNTKTSDQLVQKNEGLDSSVRQPNDYGLSILGEEMKGEELVIHGEEMKGEELVTHGEEMKGEELLNRTVKLADSDMTAKPEETVLRGKKRKMSHTTQNTQIDEDMSEHAEKIADSDMTAKPEETVMGDEEKEGGKDEGARKWYDVKFFPGLNFDKQSRLLVRELPDKRAIFDLNGRNHRIVLVYMTEEEADRVEGLSEVEYVETMRSEHGFIWSDSEPEDEYGYGYTPC
ncbi:uncharacterized protein LOC120146530 isoform X1 [Hibiscus syriacus]|uniref:uncharacterized protein LOC120146530 isoform X1 n=1 Tax=Hibiscus syriacus TaxID=106335 RepID=UPI0019218374|nr:uncharacterized protein LOC120146530 isoform X1 [Hibiscus syriacus]XP_039015998.1 uncharacterized protein LOC120146530 isoform X1 [Hibiscus syriacus]XP_039016004.1 uncharacterized protein LOC120146530 isoform X1 [Hibiscus syriacus]